MSSTVSFITTFGTAVNVVVRREIRKLADLDHVGGHVSGMKRMMSTP
jgi:hypothetical protein